MPFEIHSQADHPVVLDLEDGGLHLLPREVVKDLDEKHKEALDVKNAVRTRTIRIVDQYVEGPDTPEDTGSKGVIAQVLDKVMPRHEEKK